MKLKIKLSHKNQYRLAAVLDGAGAVRLSFQAVTAELYGELNARVKTIVKARSRAFNCTESDALSAEYIDRALGQAALASALLLLMGLTCLAAVRWHNEVLAMCFALMLGPLWFTVLWKSTEWADALRESAALSRRS